MRALALKRHHRAAPLILMFVLLVGLTMAASFAQSGRAEATTATADDIGEGQKLFAANCATCHGLGAQGQEGSLLRLSASAPPRSTSR